jgi:hypothetical protein
VNKNSNYVILCDSTSKLEEINQIIDKHNPIIIAFDYDSHNFLLENNIAHELSDDYLNSEDLDNIQDLSYKFSNWYIEPEISDLIEYEGINLGELFYLEFSYFLSPILKKFFEIQKIYQKFKNSSFISSTSHIEILKLFSSNIETLTDNDKNTLIRGDDISVKFGKFTLTSNSGNIILKNIIKLSYGFFNSSFSSKKVDHTKPTILLVNFTTLRLENFFKELPDHSINLVKYDTIAPAFWNFKTLSLIKKSGCYIENNETISKNNNFSFSENQDYLVKQKLNALLQKEQFFKRFFSLNESIFWHIIKNDFIQMFTRTFNGAIQNILKIKLLFNKYPISYIILRTEYDPLDLIIINLAKKFGIKTSILQHALYYDDLQNLNYYNFKSGQFHRELPIYSDNFLVWGKLTQIDSEKHGVPNKKIIPIGCPFFDGFLNKTEHPQVLEEQYILLAATPKTPKNLTKELSVKSQIEYYDIIKQISKITTKINKNLLIKLHHGSISKEKKIVNKINSNIVVETTGSFYQYAKKCEVLICIDGSTAILEAMLLKKPVILVLINDKIAYPEIFQNDYLITTTISELENILTKLFHDNSYKKSVIKNGEKFLDYYLNNIGTSSKALLTFLDKINDKN